MRQSVVVVVVVVVDVVVTKLTVTSLLERDSDVSIATFVTKH